MDSFGDKLGGIALVLTMLALGTSPHPVILVLCYLIHEVGHLVLSRAVGAKMKKFKIGPLHLSLSYDCNGLSYGREMAVQAGGILFNLAFGVLVALIPALNSEEWSFFAVCNFSLALMNLYPVSILDGGGLLKSAISLIWSGDVAEKVTRITSFIFAIFMWLVAVYLQIVFASNFSLFIISVLLLIELCFSV